MSSIVPFGLKQGYCLIYGEGVLATSSGLVAENTSWKFGTIYDINQLSVPIYQFFTGDNVLFNSDEVTVRLAWDNYPYTVTETAKLVGTDLPIP